MEAHNINECKTTNFSCDTVASEPMLYKTMLYHSVFYRINAATYLIIILVLFLVIAPSPQ